LDDDQHIMLFSPDFQRFDAMLRRSGETKRITLCLLAILHCCNAITDDVATQQVAYLLGQIHPGVTAMKKTSLSAAAIVAFSLAGVATSFAAELPTYEVRGLPVSPVQAAVLGATNARESQVATSAASPHQVSILTSRRKLSTAADASITTGAGH
jgi:hypothetical protein